jgi:DNA repair exonuclease SbcCD ATPase subunit
LNAKAVLTDYLTSNKPIVEAYESHRLQKQLIDKHTNSLKQKRQLQTNAQSKIATTEMQLDRIVDQQDLYNRNQQTIQRNNALKEKIAITKASYQEKLDEVVVLTAQQQDCYASLQVSVKEISDCEKSIKHMQELSEKAYAYDYYIKAISRDGIPYKLISKAVPYIETYVNSMLAQVSDFTLQLETDGKNINVFINYEDQKWPLELASGMEKFIASLAIRIALIKISNLPRPDFIAIDEGLGVLDSSNLNSMHMFFTNLKDLFNLTLIISHIDVVRDMVDKVITIDRKDGLSYINN